MLLKPEVRLRGEGRVETAPLGRAVWSSRITGGSSVRPSGHEATCQREKGLILHFCTKSVCPKDSCSRQPAAWGRLQAGVGTDGGRVLTALRTDGRLGCLSPASVPLSVPAAQIRSTPVGAATPQLPTPGCRPPSVLQKSVGPSPVLSCPYDRLLLWVYSFVSVTVPSAGRLRVGVSFSANTRRACGFAGPGLRARAVKQKPLGDGHRSEPNPCEHGGRSESGEGTRGPLGAGIPPSGRAGRLQATLASPAAGLPCSALTALEALGTHMRQLWARAPAEGRPGVLSALLKWSPAATVQPSDTLHRFSLCPGSCSASSLLIPGTTPQ